MVQKALIMRKDVENLVASRLYLLGDAGKLKPDAETDPEKKYRNNQEATNQIVESTPAVLDGEMSPKTIDTFQAKVDSYKKRIDPFRKAILAKFRNAAGRNLDDSPEVWDFIFGDYDFEENQNAKSASIKDETAQDIVFITFTLYAIHVQGGSIAHSRGESFAKAMKKLSLSSDRVPEKTDQDPDGQGQELSNKSEDGYTAKNDRSDGVTRKFNQIVLSHSAIEVCRHTRGAVQLLRQKNFPFDYVNFAGDLFELLSSANRRKNVLRGWGSEYWSYN
jgi:CRISPR type I-E-associated protein CasB/Cse2